MSAPPNLEKTKTPGVYKRGNRYVVTYRDPDGKGRKKAVGTLAEAKALKSAIATDIERGEYNDATQARFPDYARAWVKSYAGSTSKGITDDTRRDYETRLEQDAIPLFRRLRLCDIDAAALDKLASRVASGPLCRTCHGRGFVDGVGLCMKCKGAGRVDGPAPSPATVRLALAPVKALLATAVQRRDLRMNPIAGYRTRHEVRAKDDTEPERVKALSEAELRALLDAIDHVDDSGRWRPFFEFLAQTGLRIGEAIEVRWGDVDLGKQTLRVTRRYYRGRVASPKSKYGRRSIRLSPAMCRDLWRRSAEERPADDDLVWTSELGKRVDPSNLVSRVLKPAARQAGVGDWLGCHTFQAHLRDGLVPPRLERRSGAAVAWSSQAVVHARHVRALARRGPAGGRLARRDRRQRAGNITSRDRVSAGDGRRG